MTKEPRVTKKMLRRPSPPPLVKPPFTLKEIRDAIPVRCFHRSLYTSMGYLVENLLICILLFQLATYMASHLSPPLRFILWPVYWFIQGSYMAGLWVIAHECGHHAFSDYAPVNDSIGFVLHSLLLVPYYNWRITHRAHHLNTGSCEHDQVFVPPTRSTVQSAIVEMLEESPLYNFVTLLAMLTIGWMPGYLISNIGGPSKYDGKSANHFSPSSPQFLPKQRDEVLVGNFGFFLVLMGLSMAAMNFGFWPIIFYYGMPYLVTNGYLVLITFLHHTDTYVVHFREAEWTWLRGALCTIDRSMGPWLDHVLHHISDTHVFHHLFPSVPFYQAVEGTRAIQKVLGKYYLRDDTPIFEALWRAYTNCKFVEDEGDIVFYKKTLKQI